MEGIFGINLMNIRQTHVACTERRSAATWRKLVGAESIRFLFAAAVLLSIVVACAPVQTATAGSRPANRPFNHAGKVTLHRGQPCTSQIMFDFHPADSKTVVWLAAGLRQSQKLTDAAKHHRALTISGTWKAGREKGCSYVDVKNVTIQPSKWRLFFGER